MKVPSFTWAGGELSPGLYGRVDLEKYRTGVALARNFHVAVEGGLYKRSGSYLVGQPKFSFESAKTRLVSWALAPDDSYVFEFGFAYIRFIRFGGHVLYPPGHVPHVDSDAIDVDGFLEVTSPYTSTDVIDLKFAFANDTVFIFHPNHAPRVLRRLGLYDWSLDVVDFNPHTDGPTGLAGVWEREVDNVWQSASMDETDYAEHPDHIKYRISATMADGLETMSPSGIAVFADLGNSAFRVKLTWDALAGATKYTIYKSTTGPYGFIGSVNTGETLEFFDRNYAPNYDVVPLIYFEGFGTGWPRVGQFYKQRMVYASTDLLPQTMWFSRPNFFSSLTTSEPLQDDDAIKIQLVGNQRHTIRHMVQLKKFVAFTTTGEWIIEPTEGNALTAGTIDPVQETSYGSDPWLEPITIADRILFVEGVSETIRDMGYDFSSDAYNADDLSRLSRHLFKHKKIVSWAYSNFPHNALWCVCDDGTMPTLTYNRQHEIWGWTQMETRGMYLAVATTMEFNENATYFITLRNINGTNTQFIERLTPPMLDDRVENMFFVDCGLTYTDARSFTEMEVFTSTVINITIVDHGLAVDDELQIETLDFIHRFIVTAIVDDVLELTAKWDKPLEDAMLGDLFSWQIVGLAYVCADSFTGFTHLPSQTIIALGDGKVIEDIVVSETGTFTLPYKVARLHAGIPYTAHMETLSLDTDRVLGQFNERAVNDITIHLSNSRGVLAGAKGSLRALEEVPGRNVEDYDAPPTVLNGPYVLSAHPHWTYTAAVRVESPYPLPCHILNLVPDIDYGS